jgi:hypothetical protein
MTTPTPWYYQDLSNILLLLLILATVVGPVLIYLLNRSKIPKLAFDKYFKKDSLEVVTTGTLNSTTFFIKIINVNKRSEGKVEGCTGFISIGDKTYRTGWQDGYEVGTFGKEAFLSLFYIDNDQNTINFVQL